MNTIIKKLAGLSFLLLLGTVNIYAATHIVTNSNDAGTGSLRQTIQNANSGDSIVFDANVNYITLTSGQININKSLTIDGGSDTTKKITISGNNRSRIFFVDSNIALSINNLIFTKGYTTGNNSTRNGGGAIFSNVASITATNCNFNHNYAYDYGGAINLRRSTFTATNCNFNENNTAINSGVIYMNGSGSSGGTSFFTAINCNFNKNFTTRSGSVVNINVRSTFIAINCTFSNNFCQSDTLDYGGAIINYNNFIGINCTFYNNSSSSGGAISSSSIWGQETYLYHCTFDRNQAVLTGGGINSRNRLYSYNCLYIGNTPNHIRGTVTGTNMLEGVGGVTRDLALFIYY